MSRYAEKMSRILPFSQEYAEEYTHYERTMDAICSRNPSRINDNGIDMLKTKVLQLHDPDLKYDAWTALEELRREMEGETDEDMDGLCRRLPGL